MHKFSKIVAGLGVMALSFSMASVAFAASDTDDVNLEVIVDTNLSIACGGLLHVDPDVDFGTLTAGVPVVGTTSCGVTTNHEDGYDLYIDRTANADTNVLKHTDATTYISDLAAFDGTAGSTNTWTTATTQALGFRVQDVTGATKDNAIWGASTACTIADDATAEFAGVPTAYAALEPIMDHDTYSSGQTTTDICFKLDVAGTQKSGTYSGDVTFTAIGKP